MNDTTTTENRESSNAVGTGIGAVTGAAAGAAVGSIGGPIGMAIGAAVGALGGGVAGHEVAEHYDPTGEDAYWANNYRDRDYIDDEADDYELYRPAYAYGWNARRRYLGESKSWADVEPDIRSGWSKFDEHTPLQWGQAKLAVRDAWNRVDSKFSEWFGEDDRYWASHFSDREYVSEGDDYELYRPAYRFGAAARLRHRDSRWEEIEESLEGRWDRFEDRSELAWDRARHAARDAWHRVERKLPGDFDGDGR